MGSSSKVVISGLPRKNYSWLPPNYGSRCWAAAMSFRWSRHKTRKEPSLSAGRQNPISIAVPDRRRERGEEKREREMIVR
jgi:hypothetical protein